MKYSKELHNDLRFYKPTRNNSLDQEIGEKYKGIDIVNILLDEIARLEKIYHDAVDMHNKQIEIALKSCSKLREENSRLRCAFPKIADMNSYFDKEPEIRWLQFTRCYSIHCESKNVSIHSFGVTENACIDNVERFIREIIKRAIDCMEE